MNPNFGPTVLPEFKSLKSDLERRMTGSMRMAVDQDGVLGLASRIRVHEGRAWGLEREDGSGEVGEFRRFEHGIEISPSDIELRGFEAIRDLMREMHEELARHQHEALFEEIDKATKAAGTSVDSGGKPLTAELWLEGLRNMEFSFDSDGKWQPPTIVVHPNQTDRLASELKRLETDPKLRAQLDEMVIAKREEWRDREARRRLAD